MTPYCPVCNSSDLRDINGRRHAVCGFCGAYERTRLMWLVLQRLIPKDNDWDVLHFAPERGLSQCLNSATGGTYSAFDFKPEGFRLGHAAVKKFDLCADTHQLDSHSADLIVHSHVLEHVPCPIHPVVHELNRVLRPGGLHVFAVPVGGAYYECDLNPGLSSAMRVDRFGQADHMRRFGHLDVRNMFSQIFGLDVHFSRMVGIDRTELAACAIPDSVRTTVNSHSVFVWRKPVDGNSWRDR